MDSCGVVGKAKETSLASCYNFYIPKSPKNSSVRIRAAHHAHKMKPLHSKCKWHFTKRQRQKKEKHDLFLIKIQPPSNVRKVTASECIEKNVFVDGGDELNPRIVLPQLALRKEVLVLSLLLGDVLFQMSTFVILTKVSFWIHLLELMCRSPSCWFQGRMP